MKVYFRYMTDSCDQWVVFRDEDGPEFFDEHKSPSGEEAVTKRKEVPADRVSIVLQPATRIVDDVRGQVTDKDRYHVVISDQQRTFELMTQSMYRWEDAIEIARLFRDADSEKAKRIWRMKKLKQMNARWADGAGIASQTSGTGH